MNVDVPVKDHPEDTPEESVKEETDDEESDLGSETMRRIDEEIDEEKDDLWQETIDYARQNTKGSSKDEIIQEPYLSQFVDHMKEYVETRINFVKQMEDDEDYKKINDMIDRFESDDYERDEAVDAAWHNRRFLVKRIIERCDFEPIEESDEDEAEDVRSGSEIVD